MLKKASFAAHRSFDEAICVLLDIDLHPVAAPAQDGGHRRADHLHDRKPKLRCSRGRNPVAMSRISHQAVLSQGSG